MENLTSGDLLEIIVALDNESMNSKSDNERFNMLRDLKWKVFANMVKVEKEEMAKEAA